MIDRANLDEELGKYQRFVTVMFADLMGSTSFMDRYGDVAGYVRIHQFTGMLIPLAEEHGGVVCKTMGDIVMAYFDDPVGAARCASQMMVRLREINSRAETDAESLQACVGLNYGSGLIKDKDAFGHVVNVAMLIKRLARADQILLSQAQAEKLRPANLPLRKLDATEIKGNVEEMDLYELLWREIA